MITGVGYLDSDATVDVLSAVRLTVSPSAQFSVASPVFCCLLLTHFPQASALRPQRQHCAKKLPAANALYTIPAPCIYYIVGSDLCK